MTIATTAPQGIYWGDTYLVGQIGPTRGVVPRLRCDIIDFQRAKMSNLITTNLTRGAFDIVLNEHQGFPQKGVKSLFSVKNLMVWTHNYIRVRLLSLPTPGRKSYRRNPARRIAKR